MLWAPVVIRGSLYLHPQALAEWLLCEFPSDVNTIVCTCENREWAGVTARTLLMRCAAIIKSLSESLEVTTWIVASVFDWA